MAQAPIAVLGAGSWGTALAIQAARAGRPTRLWGRDPGHIERLIAERENARYLPGARFPQELTPLPGLAEAIEGCRDILVVVPSHAFRSTLTEVVVHLTSTHRVAWATKGFEQQSGLLPHQVAREVLGSELPTAVLSGPTFAKEVGAGLPSAMTIASSNEDFANDLAQSLSDENFRIYTSTDIVGVEVGGAVKNVLAIGAGLSDGLGFGANTRVALITRGLAEMMRLGVALGAEGDTFMGLAGMGDLVLTCTDDLSRNRRMGLALAAGKSAAEAQVEIGQVVEGVQAARAVWEVAQREHVDMPIAEQIFKVLYEDLPVRRAVQTLMGRKLKSEQA